MRRLPARALGLAVVLPLTIASPAVASTLGAASMSLASGHALAPHASARPSGPVPTPTLPVLGPFGQDASGHPMASGRVEDIAVDPFNASHYLALADAGLWQSANGGRTWTGLPGLGQFGQHNFEHGSIVFDPLVPGVVLISSPRDYRTPTEVGIYRSADGGQIWQPAKNGQAQCADGTTIGPPSVVVFAGHVAYAAAGCMVGTSTDDGVHWTWSAPDGGGQFSGVAVDSAGNLFACGLNGVFMQSNGTWTQVVDFNSAGWKVGNPIAVENLPIGTCRIAASPAQPSHVFFAARWTGLPTVNGADSAIFEAYSDDTGTWQAEDLGGAPSPNGRDVLVTTRPDAKTGGFDLFWNTSDNVWYQPCTNDTGYECTPGAGTVDHDPPWIPLGHGGDPSGLHADVTRILFQPKAPYCIALVSNDGGIQRPDPGNCDGTAASWSYSDAGIDAAEFYEIAITSLAGRSRPSTDLYGATQDNDAFVRLADQGWNHVSVFGDGFLVEATARTPSAGQVRTFLNSDFNQLVGGRGLSGLGPPPSGDPMYSPPCTGLVSLNQLDQTDHARLVTLCAAADLSASVYWSSLTGSGWAAMPGTLVTGQPGGLPGDRIFATEPSATTTGYVVQDNGNLWTIYPPRHPRQQLAGWNVAEAAASRDGGQLLAFACPPSPATCADAQVLASTDGGGHWRTLGAALDLATTDRWGHSFLLDTGLGCAACKQVSAVAIDRQNRRLWAIGTLDTGLLVSADSGRSWQRMPGVGSNIDSIRFDLNNRIYVATFGRGAFGGVEPSPDQLAVVATPGKIRSDKTQLFRWTVTARTFSGAAISGRIISFVLINLSDGTRTKEGFGTTNSHGVTSVSAAVPPGNYAIAAIWQPRDGADLETQADFTAQ
jgi:hypothetical protein